MAIRTGEIFNSLIFGGVNSADYGVYITGEATFNAPKRLVDMVSVPGRNGAIAIDQGHWDNIVVEYPAGFFGSDKVDFREALSDFRNAIVSQLGYQRLTDTYHPDEYRMALYVEGIEVDPTAHNTAGEFTLKFNCKPQRWLTSGETAVTVASGDTLTNPTLYDSSPLLFVEGYGNIAFNNYSIDLESGVIGDVQLFSERTAKKYIQTSDYTITCGENDTYSATNLNTGDDIKVGLTTFEIRVKAQNGRSWSTSEITSDTGNAVKEVRINGEYIYVDFLNVSQNYLAVGSGDRTASLTIVMTDSANRTDTVTLNCAIHSGTGVIYSELSASESGSGILTYFGITMGAVIADSTKSVLDGGLYIDCEIGEAYKIDGGETVAVNSYLGFGSDLPTLAPGANEITCDNTITTLQISPRWWKL